MVDYPVSKRNEPHPTVLRLFQDAAKIVGEQMVNRFINAEEKHYNPVLVDFACLPVLTERFLAYCSTRTTPVIFGALKDRIDPEPEV